MISDSGNGKLVKGCKPTQKLRFSFIYCAVLHTIERAAGDTELLDGLHVGADRVVVGDEVGGIVAHRAIRALGASILVDLELHKSHQ